MTRAEEILKLAEAVKPTPPGNPFKTQWKYSPGGKVPIHMKMRSKKNRQLTNRRNQAYSKPWSGQSNHPKDVSSTPLSSKENDTPIKRIG
jgi:hypothetical protein